MDIYQRLAGTRWYFYLNPMVAMLYREKAAALKKYARGKTLDLGAGPLTYRDMLKRHGTDIEYTSLDIEKTHPDLDVVADACGKTNFPDGAFDTVFSAQVLEHVLRPGLYLREACRLTRPGGYLILSVPFLFYLHGLPHDYFRYTPAALEHLAKEAGFTSVEVRCVGGFLAFAETVAFTAFFRVFGFLPAWMLFPVFQLSAGLAALNRLFDTSSYLPAGLLMIAKKE